MNIKKSLAIAGVTTSIGVAGLAGTHVALAATSSSNTHETLADKIAQKFNLNKSDVQAVFDQDRTERQANRQTKLENRLDKDVADGKLTAEQKDKILAKIKELQSKHEANREEFKDKTPEQRHEAMKANRQELRQWAKDNNIPLKYLHPAGKASMRKHIP